jgi:metal-dependent amidase/aminoacylase/carboxypeptidase family protein
VRPAPGLFNVIAGECDLWFDVRHPGSAALDAMALELARRCRAIAERRGVEVKLERSSGEDPTPLSGALAGEATRLAAELAVAHRRMTSGAGTTRWSSRAPACPRSWCSCRAGAGSAIRPRSSRRRQRSSPAIASRASWRGGFRSAARA